MYKQAAQELLNQINQFDDIIIHRHKRPDLDCLGSQMALKAFLQHNWPDKRVYSVGHDGFREFDYIGTIDDVNDEIYKKALVVVVDTANKARVEDERYVSGKVIIKLDHHIPSVEENYGTYNFVDEKCSSSAELLFGIFSEMMKLDTHLSLNNLIARNLFFGIYSDTGGFKFPNSQPSTFAAVSALVGYDFDYEDTIMHLTTYDHDTLKLVGYAYNHITIEDGLGYIYFPQVLQKKLGVKPSQVSLVANFLGSIKELKAWVVFNEYPSFIRVNIRSRSQYNIEPIAKMFNGGGHKNASGATLNEEAQIPQVISAIKQVLE